MAGRSRHPAFALKPYAGDDGLQVLEPGGSTVEIRSVHDDDKDYHIKVMSAQMQFGCDFIDATGEFTGNLSGTQIQDTHIESLHQLKGQIAFQGHAIPEAAIGLANLELGVTAGTITTEDESQFVDVKFLLGIGRTVAATAAQKQYLSFQMSLELVTIDWNIDQPFVGVGIRGRLTDNFGHPGASAAPLIEQDS